MRRRGGWMSVSRRLRSSGALLLLLASSAVAFAQAPAPPCPLTRGETRSIARIADGETLVLDDGRQLRLIGALAPRAADVQAPSGGWPPENETRAALLALVEGRSVSLWHDATRLDRYGQVLAHVMVGSEWLQGALVSRGLARTYGRPGLDSCSAALAELEGQARAARLGLWANAAYREREAGEDVELARATGSFQVLTGTVHRVSRGQGGIYLSLAPRRGRDAPYAVAALVASNRNDLTGGIATRELTGRRVIVRGWIEHRRGPVIVVDSKGQFELISE